MDAGGAGPTQRSVVGHTRIAWPSKRSAFGYVGVAPAPTRLAVRLARRRTTRTVRTKVIVFVAHSSVTFTPRRPEIPFSRIRTHVFRLTISENSSPQCYSCFSFKLWKLYSPVRYGDCVLPKNLINIPQSQQRIVAILSDIPLTLQIACSSDPVQYLILLTLESGWCYLVP